MFSGPLESPNNALLVPPLHAVPRPQTGRKPQRSSPLAGPAVLVSDAEETSSLLITSSSPIQGHDPNFLLPPTIRPRPKSIASGYSTSRSLHQQSLTSWRRPHAPGTKQIIRPTSSVLPFSATQEYFSDADFSCSREARNFGERCQNMEHRSTLPLTRTRGQRVLPMTTNGPPTIVLDGTSINDVPQNPPPVRPRTHMAGTMPRANSWYITSAYDDTPKFSRLGLSADNVVLPVSAKEYKKQRQRHSTSSDFSLAKDSSLKKRSSLPMGSTLASTLKLARSFTSTSSDHELAQEPSTPSTPSSLSLHTTTTFAESLDSSPTSSLSSPHPSLPRTRTRSFTNSSSSSYTCFMPDSITPSSRSSINGETTQGLAHRKDPQREGKALSISSGKGRSKSLFASKTKRSTATQFFNPESIIICPVVDKDEKKLRRGSMIRKFIRLFVPS